MPTHVELQLQRQALNEISILLEQIRTIDKQRLKDQVGQLTTSKMLEVDAA